MGVGVGGTQIAILAWRIFWTLPERFSMFGNKFYRMISRDQRNLFSIFPLLGGCVARCQPCVFCACAKRHTYAHATVPGNPKPSCGSLLFDRVAFGT